MNGHCVKKAEALGLVKEAHLWKRRGEPAVRSELANRFLAYSKSIAMRYRGRAENLDDLVQVASLGLMNAIERFDPEKGIPFVAFASPTINGELRRHFRDKVSMLRVPRGVYDRIGQMDSVVSDLRNGLAHEPTVDEIAGAMGCSTVQVAEAREATEARNPVAINDGSEDEADGVIENHLGSLDAGFVMSEDRLVTGEALDRLSRQDRTIVLMRFRDEMTQSQIADRVGCSQMQISRRLRSILGSMRESIDSPVPMAR